MTAHVLHIQCSEHCLICIRCAGCDHVLPASSSHLNGGSLKCRWMLPSLCEHDAEQMHQARLQIASHSQWTETGQSHPAAQLSTRGRQRMSGRSVLRAMCLTNPHADKVRMNHTAGKASAASQAEPGESTRFHGQRPKAALPSALLPILQHTTTSAATLQTSC